MNSELIKLHKRTQRASSIGNFLLAINLSKKILEINPKDQIAYSILSVSYAELGKYDIAEEYVQKALLIFPNNEDFQSYLCQIKYLQRDYLQTIKFANKVLRKFSFNISALYCKAMSLYQLKNYNKSKNCFEFLFILSPENCYIWCGLALVYAKLNRIEEAKELYKEALRLNPNNSTILNNYAIFLFENSKDCKHSDIMKILQSSLKIDAACPIIINNYLTLKE